MPRLLEFKHYNSTTYCKSKGEQELQKRLSTNYDFVFKNFFENGAE